MLHSAIQSMDYKGKDVMRTEADMKAIKTGIEVAIRVLHGQLPAESQSLSAAA